VRRAGRRTPFPLLPLISLMFLEFISESPNWSPIPNRPQMPAHAFVVLAGVMVADGPIQRACALAGAVVADSATW
jgi:hypothetical protein